MSYKSSFLKQQQHTARGCRNRKETLGDDNVHRYNAQRCHSHHKIIAKEKKTVCGSQSSPSVPEYYIGLTGTQPTEPNKKNGLFIVLNVCKYGRVS